VHLLTETSAAALGYAFSAPAKETSKNVLVVDVGACFTSVQVVGTYFPHPFNDIHSLLIIQQ
jgi:molecular chaperone DnaK (HSP70)